MKLKGVSAEGRLREGGFNGMVSHHVQVTSTDDIDQQLIAWMQQAYAGAG